MQLIRQKNFAFLPDFHLEKGDEMFTHINLNNICGGYTHAAKSEVYYERTPSSFQLSVKQYIKWNSSREKTQKIKMLQRKFKSFLRFFILRLVAREKKIVLFKQATVKSSFIFIRHIFPLLLPCRHFSPSQ